MVVRRNVEEGIVQKVFPNPFEDELNILFTSIINEKVIVKIYDPAGRLMYEKVFHPKEVFINISNIDLPFGTYLLNVMIDEQEPTIQRIISVR